MCSFFRLINFEYFSIYSPQHQSFYLYKKSMRNNHEIDYKIYGEELQFVEVELDPLETVIGEPGGFMMMEDGIEMQTIFGDGSQQPGSSGLIDRLMNAGRRVLVGENMFMTAFTNVGQGKKKVSFAAPYTGKIICLDLQALGGSIIAQKDAFLCAAKGVSIGIAFSAKDGYRCFWWGGIYHGKTGWRWPGICACRWLYYGKRTESG